MICGWMCCLTLGYTYMYQVTIRRSAATHDLKSISS